jgi:hypothetical protein
MQISKVEIHETILKLLTNSILQATRDYELAKESRDSDTKSSAGDKFETGREMMQREMDKISALIDTTQNSLKKLNQLPLSPALIVCEGSIVDTDQGTYYISIGLGKIDEVYAISIESPMGVELKGKRVGENIEMRGRKIIIKSIS